MRRGEADRLVPGHTDGGGRGGSLPIWCGEGRGRDECFCVEDTLHRSRACQVAGEQVTLEESPGVASRELSTRRTVLWLSWAVGSVQVPSYTTFYA